MGSSADPSPKSTRFRHELLPRRPRPLDFPVAHESDEGDECQDSCTHRLRVLLQPRSHEQCCSTCQHQPHWHRTNHRPWTGCVWESQAPHDCSIGGGAAQQQDQLEHGCKRERPCRRLQTGWQANRGRTPPPSVGTHLRRFLCAASALRTHPHASHVRPGRRSSRAWRSWSRHAQPHGRAHPVGPGCVSAPTRLGTIQCAVVDERGAGKQPSKRMNALAG
eukprot:scaffold856_cov326-Pavlova_lutheri.AAC.26